MSAPRVTPHTFAYACVEQNSIDELEEALADYPVGEADSGDCASWGLTPAQWRGDIEIALAHLRANP